MTNENIRQVKQLVYDLIIMVEEAQIHPVTCSNNYPEYIKKANEIGHKIAKLMPEKTRSDYYKSPARMERHVKPSWRPRLHFAKDGHVLCNVNHKVVERTHVLSEVTCGSCRNVIAERVRRGHPLE
jgi:hypothetical protein